MLIQEEYARRHGLTTTLANHTLREGVILLRRAKEFRSVGSMHVMLSVKWVPHDRHPGTYQFSFRSPVHDSLTRTNYTLLAEPTFLNYEDFDHDIRNVRRVRVPDYRATYDLLDVNLFVWEMFLVCFDTWIVRNGSHKFLGHVEATVDPALSLVDRHKRYINALMCLRIENSSVFERWEMYFDSQRTKALPWMGKLFNGD